MIRIEGSKVLECTCKYALRVHTFMQICSDCESVIVCGYVNAFGLYEHVWMYFVVESTHS